MAGDWIKIEHAMPDKPEVFRISDRLGVDPDAVAGKLLRLWIWCDQQTVDGASLGVTDGFVDRLTRQDGFASALRDAGWLHEEGGSLSIPRFDRHNGSTAKARAGSNQRTKKARSGKQGQPKETPPQGEQETFNLDGDTKQEAKPPKASKLPTTPEAKRIHALFNRKETTAWSDKEIKVFKSLQPMNPEDLTLIERYYKAERAKPEGCHRRDLATFLNNYQGEVDRARLAMPQFKADEQKHGEKPLPQDWQEFLKDRPEALNVAGLKEAKVWAWVPASVKTAYGTWRFEKKHGK